MNEKELNAICEYIKKNPGCVIEYYNQQNFIIYKNSKKKFIEDHSFGWDLDIDDNGLYYIPNIALIFHTCVKKGIDISKIQLRSC